MSDFDLSPLAKNVSPLLVGLCLPKTGKIKGILNPMSLSLAPYYYYSYSYYYSFTTSPPSAPPTSKPLSHRPRHIAPCVSGVALHRAPLEQVRVHRARGVNGGEPRLARCHSKERLDREHLFSFIFSFCQTVFFGYPFCLTHSPLVLVLLENTLLRAP